MFSQTSSNITLSFRNIPLKEALSRIEKVTQYTFFYDAAKTDLNLHMSLSVQNATINQLMSALLSNTGIAFEITNKQIALISNAKTTQPLGPIKAVTGTISDEKGERIIGANIAEKGTPNGAISDINGGFTLDAHKGGTLVVSFVGYATKEIHITDQSQYKIVLAENLEALEEVVVVGYGRQNRKDVTGAVTNVKAADMNVGVISNPGQLLQGKVPGLNITRSGNPNEGPSMTLRGPSSLREGANAPFYVIDGVPGASIDLVAPSDIVSMDILRDASSTAIYGSRAANGVIMVTTKRATDEKSYLTYNGYVASESVSKRYDMMTGDQLRSYTNNQLQPIDDVNGANTNWQDEVQRTALSHNHNLSFGGSGKSTVYGASLDYRDTEGIIKGSGFERYIFRTNVEQRFFDDRLSLGVNLSHSNTKSESFHSDVLLNMLQFLPTVPVRKEDGSFTENPTRTGYYANPMGIIENDIIRSSNSTTLANGYLKVKIIEGLTANLSYSMQRMEDKYNTYNSSKSMIRKGTGGYAIRNAYTSSNDIIEGYANYEKTVAKKHDFKAMVGYSWQQDRYNEGFQAANSGFITDDLTFNNIALGNAPDKVSDEDRFGSRVVSTLRMISFYGRVNYQFDNRYLFQASIRRDGSSAFGANNRWGTFPAFSVGWKINNEAFMQQQKVFSDLRLRASWGQSGNSSGFDPMISLLKYGKQGITSVNGKDIVAIGPTQNPNPDLRWETTAMFNVGLDFGFFNNRLTGTVEYYDKVTNDLIWDYAVPATEYLVGTLLANVGKVSNRGVELSLNARIIENKDFRWNSSLNLSHNKNNVESITNEQFTDTYRLVGYLGGLGQSGVTGQIIKEGSPIGTFYLPKYAGNASGVSMFYDKDGKETAQPTSVDFYEFTKGTAQPTIMYGWQNNFSYKNFDLGFFLRGIAGNYIMNSTRSNFFRTVEANQFNILADAANEPRTDNRAHFNSDRYIESGSYLRLDNATLGYTFKFNKACKSLRLYVTGNNLFVLTGYKGIDPELNLGGITPGIDNKNYYPKTRSFMFGLTANF